MSDNYDIRAEFRYYNDPEGEMCREIARLRKKITYLTSFVDPKCYFSDDQIDSLWHVFDDDQAWSKKMRQALSKYGVFLCPECRGDKVVKSKTAPCFIGCPVCDGKAWIRIK